MLPAPLAPGFVTKHPGQNRATPAASAALYLHSLREGRKKILHVLEVLWMQSEEQALMLQALQLRWVMLSTQQRPAKEEGEAKKQS